MNAFRTMAMVAALGTATFVMGCKDKNAGGSTNGGASTTNNTGGAAKTPAAASGPQATLDQFIEAMQLADFDTAIELCDESDGRQQLFTMKAMWDDAQAKVDQGVPGMEIAVEAVRQQLLGPWENASGTVSQTEGNFSQATVQRSGGAEPVTLNLNKVDNKWLIIAPAELFGGGTASSLPGAPKKTPPSVPLPTTTPQ